MEQNLKLMGIIMIKYIVNIKIDSSVKDVWLEWMRGKHIPDVMNTGLFQSAQLLEDTEDESGCSFSVHYTCDNFEKFEKYRREYALALQDEHTERFKGKFEAMRRILNSLKVY